MKYVVYFIFVTFFSFGNVMTSEHATNDIKAQMAYDDLKVFDFDELQRYLEAKDDSKTYVVNFWATWCAPCVKELPYFEELNANYSAKDVEVILISLDFPKQIDSKLKPFLKKKGLTSEVVVLDDVDSNTWIPKVNENWSGAIPATLIYNKNKTAFYERSFDYQELETELKPFLK